MLDAGIKWVSIVITSQVNDQSIQKSNGLRLYAQGTGKVRVIDEENLSLLQHLGHDPLDYSEIVLVSHGEEKDRCGEVRAKLFCETTGKFLHDLRGHCDRGVCPVCWQHWCERETKAASEKVMVGLRLLKRENSRYRANHVVFSVPPEDYHLSTKQLRSRLNYRMKKAGVVASCVGFHPFRIRGIYTKKKVTWRHCSLNRNAESPVVASEVYYSPHFHVVAVGYLMSVIEFYEKYRWRYYKVNKTALNTLGKIRRVLWYVLSHAGIVEGQHVITWTGRWSNNQMLVTHIERELVYPKCPCCGGGIIIEHQEVFDRWLNSRELYSIMITRRHYRFKEKGS